MWHWLTSGIWADGVWWTLDKEAILTAGGQGTLISEPTKKVANGLLGFPSVHIIGWRVSLFAQTLLEIVPLMINGMRAKKVLSETVVDSTCSLFNWLFGQVGAHAKPVVSAWHGFRQQESFFQLHGNVVTSPFCGDWEGAEALAALPSLSDSSLFSSHLVHDFMVPGTSFVCCHPSVGWVVFYSRAHAACGGTRISLFWEAGRNSKLKQAGSGSQRTVFSTHFLMWTASQFYLMSKKRFPKFGTLSL